MTSARARRSMLPGYSSQIGAAQSSPALSLETPPVQYTEVAVPQSSNLAFDPRGLVTLSWDASHTATLPEQPAPLVNETPPIPFGAPPAYVRSLKPQSDVIYTFSPGTRDTMLLVPPPESPDTRPKFHISIGMNPFTPFSYITTVRQGGTENGKLVGEFEMSGMLNEVHMEWVTFDRIRQKTLSHVLSVCSTHADGVGLLDRPNERPRRWKYNNLTLYWVFDGDNKTKRHFHGSVIPPLN
ncbi:hypothetical protein VKT23_011908 [Stygiomarasmius scandens]|uniref:Uncharacterized protein n=1 Tax=Marasmiellus scandens TaxID=2682957 RepID=A0ABR1J9X9_9AGAR